MKRRYRIFAWRSLLKTTFVLLSICIYTLLSGAGPAALRAGVMASIMIIAPRLGRIYNIYTALAFSALLMSIFDPFLLWDAGFLLSFLGTLGIVLLTPFFQRLFHPLTALPFGHQIVEIAASTFAAQVATLPIFAIIFQEVSFIAPVTNILTVPLLGLLLAAGSLLCILDICAPLLATLFAWALQPLLSYMLFITHWCANLPYAYITAPGLNTALAWGYYIILTLLFLGGRMFFRPTTPLPSPGHPLPHSFLPTRTLRIFQIGAALLMILVTGTSALAAQPDGRLSLLFFAVGQPAQGDALLIRTPDGKTALIDGGLDPVALAQQLDSRLPVWQHSLDMVILTTPRPEALKGLQDVVTRYQVGAVFDPGMLHPTATYALWRHTIELRHIPYQQAYQGMSIPLGTQVALQILSPALPLHKSSDEQRDDALIFRLVSPSLSLLFLGVASQSVYALQTLLSNIALNYLRVQIVDIAEAKGETFPVELAGVLQQAQPVYLMMTPALLNAKQRKNTVTTPVTSIPPSSSIETGNWQIERIAQVGTVEVVADGTGWSTSINQS